MAATASRTPLHVGTAAVRNAEARPDDIAFEFREAPDSAVQSVTRAELVGRAAALAGRLPRDSNQPVLVMYPAGIEYVVAVLGCLLAGVPVVPAYPVQWREVMGDRLDGMRTDSGARLALGAAEGEPLSGVTLLQVPGRDEQAEPRPLNVSDVAVVQYTSGSTGRPRGVRVRHSNLAANTAAIADRFGLRDDSVAMSWLPPFHDMGLVGGILTPLVTGVRARLMPPQVFLVSPLTWLQEIDDAGATVSGAPNFAYDLCARRAARSGPPPGLNLSRWEVAFNGAERIRPSTLTTFAETFAGAGFEARAFFPCYGLAEATLMVTAGRLPETAATHPGVSCGHPVPGQEVHIVDVSDEARPVEAPPGDEGEIWIAGDHVTDGMWSGDDDDLFGVLDGRRHLRTGDIGRWAEDGLLVTGRRKDVIVCHGANHHAEDVEDAARAAAPDRCRVGAAFQVEDDHASRVVLVQEVQGKRDAALADRVRAEVLERCALALDDVVLVPPRSIPRTSSGKVRRAETRQLHSQGAFRSTPNPAPVEAEIADGSGSEGSDSTPPEGLTGLFVGVVAELCGRDDVDGDTPLRSLGLDSVKAAEAAAVVGDALGAAVPLGYVLAADTAADLAASVWSEWSGTGEADAVAARLDALDSLDDRAGATAGAR